jgi:serine/threonine-protein kinase
VSEALPIVFGDYLLAEPLGSGGTAEVFLAKVITPGLPFPSPLVIKRLHAEHAEDQRFVLRFEHEAKIAILVDSPHVARVYDAGSAGGALYIAMELVEGWSLAEVIERAREEELRVPAPVAVELVAQALAGVAALHALKADGTGEPLRFAHRDLSPKNLMLGRDGIVRVIDLGLGRSEAQAWRTRAGAVMGTVGYMSPEQVTGKPVDHRTDLYTLAVVLFELLAGRPLFARAEQAEMMRAALRLEAPSIAALRGDVPMELDAILRRGLAKRPEDRFASAAAFLAALDRTIDPQTRAGSIRAFLVSSFDLAKAERAHRELEERLSKTPPLAALKLPAAESTIYARLEKTAATVLAPPPPPTKPATKLWIAALLLVMGILFGVVARLAAKVL